MIRESFPFDRRLTIPENAGQDLPSRIDWSRVDFTTDWLSNAAKFFCPGIKSQQPLILRFLLSPVGTNNNIKVFPLLIKS